MEENIDRKKHLKAHSTELRLDSQYFKDIVNVLEEDGSGWTPCVGCKKLVGYTNELSLCLQCVELDENVQAVTTELKQVELQCFRTALEKMKTKYEGINNITISTVL